MNAGQRILGGIVLLYAACLSLGSVLDGSTGLRGTIGRVGAFGAIVLALLAIVVLAYAGIGSLGRRR